MIATPSNGIEPEHDSHTPEIEYRVSTESAAVPYLGRVPMPKWQITPSHCYCCNCNAGRQAGALTLGCHTGDYLHLLSINTHAGKPIRRAVSYEHAERHVFNGVVRSLGKANTDALHLHATWQAIPQ